MLLEDNKKAIVIVAHPDDETIWAGGIIMKYPKVDWTIFSLCRASDKDRAPKFKKVCKFYGVKGIISDLDDEHNYPMKRIIKEAKRIILSKINLANFNYVFTHGENGEYGHPRHLAVNLSVKQILKNIENKPEAVFYFNYKKISKKEFSFLTFRKNSDLLLKLSNKEFNNKKKIISDIYGFDPKGIDIGYCTNPEAFKVKYL